MSKMTDKGTLIKLVNETNPDIIMFMPPDKKGQTINFNMANYSIKSKKMKGTVLGDCYDIILFQLDDKQNITGLDRFEAVLIEPIQYITGLIDDNFYGMVGRLTKKSRKFFDKLYNELT